MGLAMSVPQLLIILVIVVLIFGTRRTGIDDHWLRSRSRRELGRTPVYSAETTSGKEAEFIRDRLPKRFPTVVVFVVVLVVGAALWWLTR
jgi:hypothetical protein